MRILFVTDFYHPYSGGVEIHVRTVARELADRGHAVAVATLPTAGGVAERSADGPVEVYTVRHTAQALGARFKHQDRPWAPPFPDPLAALDLRRAVSDFRPEVIHGHDWLARSALPRIVGGKIPVLTSLHYYTRTCAKKTLWHDGRICSGPGLLKCLACASRHYGPVRGAAVTLGLRAGAALEDRRTDRWISVSAATEVGNDLAGRENSVVVANPVPTVSLSAQDSTPAPLPEGVPAGPFILFVGDIRPEKGVAVLAEAVDMLRSEHGHHLPLVVVGERTSQEIALPAGTIEVGHVANDEVQRLWRCATVGVVPSLWPEPFGRVAVEAMAAGCPLVASRVGGLAEVLADGLATLVPPGDPRALANALSGLLSDPIARERQAARAMASVERYSVDRIVDRIEELYRSAIGDR